jgi:hypothetical protein
MRNTPVLPTALRFILTKHGKVMDFAVRSRPNRISRIRELMVTRRFLGKDWWIVGLVFFFILCQPACSLFSGRSGVPSQIPNTIQATQISPSLNPKAAPSQISTITATPTLPTQTPVPTKTEIPTITNTVTPTEKPPTITPTATYSEYILIGNSVLGRPLEVYRFGNGLTRRMVVAGIHGGAELNTIKLADELIQRFLENPKLIPSGMTLYILRSLNPDGEVRASGPDGRANQNGVDLNRNWDAFWQSDPDLSGCWSLYTLSTGEYPHSEPETQALADFILEMKIDALISYHSAGQGIYAGGQPVNPNSVRLAQWLSEASGYLYPPIDAGCVYTGQLIDWAVQQGIAAVDIELPNKWETQLDINFQVMEAFLEWER